MLAARAAGRDILDGVHTDLTDETGLEQVCQQGRALGFDGKTLIHPRQIAIANRVFSPSTAELEQARRLVAGWQQARAGGRGVTVVDGRLVEHLHVEQARRTLALAAAIGQAGS